MLEGIFDSVISEEKLIARSQQMVEGNTQMPEGYNIIATMATANVTRCEVLNGEVDIEGMVVFNVLCNTESETVCLRTPCSFNQNITVQGAHARANAAARIELSDIQAEIYGGEIVVSALADISVEVTEKNELKCIKEINGDIQTMGAEVEVNVTAGSGMSRTTVEKELELSAYRLPELSRVLLSSAEAEITDSYCSEDRVMIAGDVIIKVLLLCQDEYEPFAEIEERIDFTQVIEAQGTDADCIASVEAMAEEIFVEVHDNEEGKLGIINCQVIVNSRATATKKMTHNLISDAYSTGCEINCTYKNLNIVNEKKYNSHSSLRLPATLPQGMPPIAKVLLCDAHSAVCNIQTEDSRVAIDGVIDAVIIYKGAGAGLCSYNAELPFSCELNLPEIRRGDMCDVRAKVAQKSAIITAADEAELRVQLEFDVTASDNEIVKVLTDAEEGESYGQRSAICIYTVQNNDTEWSVAKYLGVTVDELREFNPDMSQCIPGTKVMAYRQIRVD